jgi:hypothetical protein
MAFSGPELSDYENVVALNQAWLCLLQKGTRLSEGIAELPERLQRRITNLSQQEITRLAATPFLLFSFREGDDRYWEGVLAGSPERNLFAANDTDDVDILVSASLGFIWQLARRNPYTLRLICGASIYWTEQIAEQTFFGLLEAVRLAGEMPCVRFVQQRELWNKLLDRGLSREVPARHAAQLSALQTILTAPRDTRPESRLLAARTLQAPRLCMAGKNEPTQT